MAQTKVYSDIPFAQGYTTLEAAAASILGPEYWMVPNESWVDAMFFVRGSIYHLQVTMEQDAGKTVYRLQTSASRSSLALHDRIRRLTKTLLGYEDVKSSYFDDDKPPRLSTMADANIVLSIARDNNAYSYAAHFAEDEANRKMLEPVVPSALHYLDNELKVSNINTADRICEAVLFLHRMGVVKGEEFAPYKTMLEGYVEKLRYIGAPYVYVLRTLLS